jgi:hypothetical protein
MIRGLLSFVLLFVGGRTYATERTPHCSHRSLL